MFPEGLFLLRQPEVKQTEVIVYQTVISTGTNISNVIYRNFSHNVTSYTFSGENNNIMLEFLLNLCKNNPRSQLS